MLEVRGLELSYGATKVLHGIDLTVDHGSIVSVTARNATGKTSLGRAILGLVAVETGTIAMDGRNLISLSTPARIGAGLALVPEGRGIIAPLTVWENLCLGGYGRLRGRLLRQMVDSVAQRFPFLRERRNQLAGTLSGGEQGLLAIARALVGRPRYLIVDEPLLGLSPANGTRVLAVLRELTESAGVLIFEQGSLETLNASDYGYVLAAGRVVAAGTPQELSLQPDAVRHLIGASAGPCEPVSVFSPVLVS